MQTHIALVTALMALAFGGAACRQPTSDPGHDHAEEPKTAQITVWSDRYEVFAEHRAPVAGKPTTFTTHVTDLQTWGPRAEGMVTFVLQQGETRIEHPQAAPARPGIYLPAILFPKPGDWHLTLHIPTDGTNSLVDLGTIRVYADDHAAAHAEVPQPPDGVSFLKEQQWKTLTRTEPVAKRPLVERVPVPAQVRAKPGFHAAVAAPLPGHLQSAPGRAFPQPGARVQAGETLAVLQPRFSDAAARFMEIEAEFGRAEAVLKQAEAAFERTKKLAAQQARSERELQEAEVALATAKARHAAAASLRATYAAASSPDTTNRLSALLSLELRAPIEGILTTVSAGLGESVGADQTVFTILNPVTVWIEGRVSEFTAARLGEARDALLELPGSDQQFVSIAAEGGRLVFAGLEVDAATRTVPLLYELPNHRAQLRAGQSASLHVETSRIDEALAIPDSAIVEEAGQPIAFVQVSGETFEKRELTLGVRDGNFVQVLRGVSKGERIVTKGALAIRLASVSNVIPAHGHAH